MWEKYKYKCNLLLHNFFSHLHIKPLNIFFFFSVLSTSASGKNEESGISVFPDVAALQIPSPSFEHVAKHAGSSQQPAVSREEILNDLIRY